VSAIDTVSRPSWGCATRVRRERETQAARARGGAECAARSPAARPREQRRAHISRRSLTRRRSSHGGRCAGRSCNSGERAAPSRQEDDRARNSSPGPRSRRATAYAALEQDQSEPETPERLDREGESRGALALRSLLPKLPPGRASKACIQPTRSTRAYPPTFAALASPRPVTLPPPPPPPPRDLTSSSTSTTRHVGQDAVLHPRGRRG